VLICYNLPIINNVNVFTIIAYGSTTMGTRISTITMNVRILNKKDASIINNSAST